MREAAKEIVDGAYALHCKFEIGNQREIETKGITALIAKHVASRTRALEEAANVLIDYCEDHNWGTMPEPFASINPLLKLLGRTEKDSHG